MLVGKTSVKRRHPSSKDDADEAAAKRAATVANEKPDVSCDEKSAVVSVQCDDPEAPEASSSRLSSSSTSSDDDDGDTPTENQNLSSAAASILLVPKERPTTLDMVVKNVEALFRLLKK